MVRFKDRQLGGRKIAEVCMIRAIQSSRIRFTCNGEKGARVRHLDLEKRDQSENQRDLTAVLDLGSQQSPAHLVLAKERRPDVGFTIELSGSSSSGCSRLTHVVQPALPNITQPQSYHQGLGNHWNERISPKQRALSTSALKSTCMHHH